MIVRSYRSAFILLFLVLLIITVLGVSSNAYRRASVVSLDLSADIIAEMSEKVVSRTVGIFEQARGFLETDALTVAAADAARGEHLPAQREVLFRIFAKQLELVPQIQSLYVADPEGNFLQVRRSPQLSTRAIERTTPAGAELTRPRERIVYRNAAFEPIAHINGGGLYDPRERPWYAQAKEAELSVTPVYRFASDERPGVTLVRGVRGADGGLRFVLGADVALDGISELLAEQRLAKHGVALIVDSADALVAFPYWLPLDDDAAAGGTTDARLPLVTDLETRWLVDAFRGSRSGEARVSGNGAVEYTLSTTDGARYIGHLSSFPGWLDADWSLFIAVPEASLLSSASRLFSESVVISLIMLALAALTVSMLALQLLRPLQGLVENTEHLGQFRFDQVRRVRSRFREIQAMDTALWRMRQGLQSLEKFVPTAVARRLVESDDVVSPAAEVRELTVLFTGISRFAELCCHVPPERITGLLTLVLDRFTQVILRLKGTIDNYLGESILAFWGAPTDCTDGAARACEAALACLELEPAMFADWDDAAATPPMNLFSVHVGPCIVGALGSSLRMSYTAVGDNIARGWQLRRLNHRYGTRILVSAEARGAAGDGFWFRRLDVLPAEHPEAGGRPLEVFELVGRRDQPLPPAQADRIERYERALALLLERQWEQAEAGFQALADGESDDPAVRLMLERCRRRDPLWCPEARSPTARPTAVPESAAAENAENA